ncbi:MAG: type II toxin-antitoxin system RelE/ParE family toxin [Planctomycetia bacterium]|nr:type II toxin-antitoxin system RelE/ParE family toxin [Planctomycetia bacterium]
MTEHEVEFHPQARQEYLGILQDYMVVSKPVARRFQECVAHAVKLISEGPEQWPAFDASVRFVRLRRFPYVLYFEPVGEQRVQVLAVAHGRRRPGYRAERRNQ